MPKRFTKYFASFTMCLVICTMAFPFELIGEDAVGVNLVELEDEKDEKEDTEKLKEFLKENLRTVASQAKIEVSILCDTPFYISPTLEVDERPPIKV